MLRPGDKYNRLTVLGYSHTHQKKHYHVRCECGTEKIVSGSKLKIGATRSCGCLRREPRLPNNHAEIMTIISKYRNRAATKNLLWDLTDEQVGVLVRTPCFYCGAPPSNKLKKYKYGKPFEYNGIDRLDNSKGYTLQNVVPCCGMCNRGKLTSTVSEFLNWVRNIAKHSLGMVNKNGSKK